MQKRVRVDNPGVGRTWRAVVLRGLLVLALIPLAFAGASVWAETRTRPGEGWPCGHYRQTVELVFDSSETAAGVDVEIEPVYQGKSWAFSSRWDDNHRETTGKIVEELSRRGIRGTWYLTRINQAQLPAMREAIENAVAHGFGIGCHSLTHPYLPYQNINRIFEEVCANRSGLEALTSQCIGTFGFPLCVYGSDLIGSFVEDAVMDSLNRAGCYHGNNPGADEGRRLPIILSPLLFLDGALVGEPIDAALGRTSYRNVHPIVSIGMHAPNYLANREAMRALEGLLAEYGGRDDVWYCTENEYGAYRKQVERTRLVESRVDGDRLRIVLERPSVIDLNDSIPLTLALRGVSGSQLREARCDTADLTRCPDIDGRTLIDLTHDRDRRLAQRIAYIELDVNTRDILAVDSAFPDLLASLAYAEETLRLTVRTPRLDQVRLTWRLPPGFRSTGGIETIDRIEGELTRSLPLERRTDDPRFHAGVYYFNVQLDFIDDGVPCRLHLARRAPGGRSSDEFPQGRTLRCGPLPPSVDIDRIARRLSQPGAAMASINIGEHSIAWTVDEGPQLSPWLNPEVLRIKGEWSDWRELERQSEWYLLVTEVVSERRRPVAARFDQAKKRAVQQALLNGAPVDTGAELGQGSNRLVIIYRSPPPQSHEHVGFFFRLVDPSTGERLSDIRYKRPA